MQEFVRSLLAIGIILLFDQQGKDMRSYVSVRESLTALILMDELVQDLDHVDRVLVILSQRNELYHFLPVILENAVKLNQAVEDKILVTLHFLDYFEETLKQCLHFFLVIWILE